MKFSTGTISLDFFIGALACVVVFYLILRRARIPKGLRLPPGPPGKFLMGNVADMPQERYWETFEQWSKRYGDIVHVKLFGQSMIFVNSLEVARDLFDKRSNIYSDRPYSHMIIDLMGWDWNIPLMPYGDWWRRHRKMFHDHFSSAASAKYNAVQIRQTHAFLQSLQKSPAAFVEHIHYLTGSIIMEIVYGIKLLPKDDPYVAIAEKATSGGAEAAVPGKFLVDILPFLKYVPEWFPGAGFRRKAKVWRQAISDMSSVPFAAVKNALVAGTAQPSIAGTLLEELALRTNAPPDEESVIRNVTGVAYAGGADTTVSTLTSFILAMVLHPEVQRKAQAELDTVIGNRLPLFEDQEKLPYVNAICKEVHRWHPAFPLGIGHRVMQDDVYKGYFIPKGSIVIGTTWTILHEEKIYGPDRHEFNPERFLGPGAPDLVGQFGFGRRICPGRFMADSSVYIAVASILKAFDISPAKDDNGNVIPVKAEFTSGLLSHPEPFVCTIKPRSESLLLTSGYD